MTAEALNSKIIELVKVYEAVKPIVHYNISYDVEYYNGKTSKLRSTNFNLRRKLVSIVLPTGGWFGVFLFKRHIRKMFHILLSTCDLCLLVEEKKSYSTSYEKDEFNKIKENIIKDNNKLTERKPSHRAEHFSMALQIASVIIAFASIGWLQTVFNSTSYACTLDARAQNSTVELHCPPPSKDSRSPWYWPILSELVLIFAFAYIFTLTVPKYVWYRRVIESCHLKDKEKEVCSSFQKMLEVSLNGNKSTEFRILFKDNPSKYL
jgi:hypothetical protein